jgi:hypothetical protein
MFWDMMLSFGWREHSPCLCLLGLLEMLWHTNPTTQRHIPEGSSLHHHRCESLKSSIKYLPLFYYLIRRAAHLKFQNYPLCLHTIWVWYPWTRLQAGWSGVRFLAQARSFSSPKHLGWLCSPPSLLVNGYWKVISPGLKRLGREADHSFPSSAHVKNDRSYSSSPPSCLNGVHRGNYCYL